MASPSILDNYNQRLIFKIDMSTLQSLVITRQQKFREQLAKEMIAFNGKPSVEHALRSYLRICMPMTIETEINNVLTVFDRTGEGPEQNLTTVMTSEASVRATQAFKPAELFKPRNIPVPPESKEARKVFIPVEFYDRDLRDLQDALCVSDGDVGTANQATTAKIQIFEDYFRSIDGIVKDKKITNRYEFGRATKFGPCPKSLYKNIYEREEFSSVGSVRSLFENLEEEKVAGLVTPSSFSLASMRDNIAKANASLGIALPAGADADEITPSLAQALKMSIQPKP